MRFSSLHPLSLFFSVWPHLSRCYWTSSFSFSIVLTAEPKEAHCVHIRVGVSFLKCVYVSAGVCVCVCVWCSSDPLISVRRNRGGLVLPSRVRGRVESAITLFRWDTHTHTHTIPGLHAQWGICLWTDNLVNNSSARNAHKHTHTGIDRKDRATLYLCTVWLLQPQVSLSAVSHLSQPCRHSRAPHTHIYTYLLGGHFSLCWHGSSFSSWLLWCTGVKTLCK